MENIFLRILNMSIQASLLIVVVFLLRFILSKSPKWIHCLLWGLVAIRLVCPFSIETTFSLAPNAKTISLDVNESRPNIRSGITFIDRSANAYIETRYSEGLAIPENEEAVSPLSVVSFVWLAGMVINVIKLS